MTRYLCLSVVPARSACLPLAGLTPGLGSGPGMYFFCLSKVNLVSQLCGGPGPEPEVGSGRAVPNFRLSCGAVTIFSKLKINVDSFSV